VGQVVEAECSLHKIQLWMKILITYKKVDKNYFPQYDAIPMLLHISRESTGGWVALDL